MEFGSITQQRERMNDDPKQNILKDKSYAFALRIVKVNTYLTHECRQYVLAKQLLRSGTSIGANVAEANQAQSRADFISKRGIALKETVETEYWLNLLRDSGFLTKAQAGSLIDDCLEIKAIVTAAIKRTKRNSQSSALNSQFS